MSEGDGGYHLHYDPAIAKHFAWPLMLDINLWHVWNRVAYPVLVFT